MSGQRHHHIPRFLLKGFSSYSKGKEIYSWVYDLDKDPYKSNIKNIAVENNFYSIDGDGSIDDLITRIEDKFARLVRNLREIKVDKVGIDGIPELLAHLETRSNKFRIGFVRASELMLNAIKGAFNDPNFIIPYLLQELNNEDSETFKQSLAVIEKSGFKKEQLRDLFSHPLFREYIIEYIKTSMPGFIDKFLGQIDYKMIYNSIKRGQLNALAQDLTPKARVNYFSELNYWLVEVDDENLVLGDCISIVKIDDNVKTISHGDSRIDWIILPISNNRYLIGANEKIDYKAKYINKLIAERCNEYFVSSVNNSSMLDYKSIIGKHADEITKEEIDDILYDLKN